MASCSPIGNDQQRVKARLRVVALLLMLLLVGETTLVLRNIGQPWWVPPIIAMVCAIGVFSGLRYADRDALFRRSILAMENWLFLNPRRSYASTGSLAAAAIVMIGIIVCTWPPPMDYLSVMVYREKREHDHFVVGARVLLLNERAGTTTIVKVGDNGRARFDNLVVPVVATLQINEVRDHIEWSWTPERFTLHTLPAIKDYDLASVEDQNWNRIRKPPEQELSNVDELPRSGDRRQIGDPALQAANAPCGVPDAPMTVNRYSYILGLAPALRVPMWAAYAVAVADGRMDRGLRRWKIDPLIPENMQATLADYRRSGYDRGHLVSPLDVMFKGRVAVLEASYLAAVTPQVPELNRGAWLELERATRNLARRLGREVYVVDGPLFEDPDPITIGANDIPVPSHFFRVVTWIENGAFQWAAHLVPNGEGVPVTVQHSAVPIIEIEQRAGLVLLPRLPECGVTHVKRMARSLPVSAN